MDWPAIRFHAFLTGVPARADPTGGVQIEATAVAVEDDIDDTAKRPKAVDATSSAGQNFDSLDGVERNGVQVGLAKREIRRGNARPTPRASDPNHLMGVLAGLAARLPSGASRVGVAFPSVVKPGRVRTAANINSAWVGTDGAALVAKSLTRPAVFLNDADAAGMAEMRWGAGRGVKGPVVMLTFGTGIGTALFIEGRLFPNTELGHLELHGSDAEKWASAQVRTLLSLDWPAWIERVNDYLRRLQAYLWPDLFIIGGGVSKHFSEFAPLLHSEAEIRPAHFFGDAGVIGAALAAVDA